MCGTLNVRLWPYSVAIADLMRLPLCAISRLMQCSKQASLFDHLVGGGKQSSRDSEAERLCGFEIDGKLKLSRLPNR